MIKGKRMKTARWTIIIGILLIAAIAWAQEQPPVLPNGSTRVEFVVDSPAQKFQILTNGQSPTTLSARAEPSDFPFVVEVHDAEGDLVAQITNLQATRLSLSPTNASYEITVTAGDPARAGVVILSARGGLEPTPTFTATFTRTPTRTPTPTPTSTPTPLSSTVACTVTTNSRANIRREPNREGEVVGLLTIRTQIGANRLSDDGLWYGVVLLDETQGWIFAEAIREITPCDFARP